MLADTNYVCHVQIPAEDLCLGVMGTLWCLTDFRKY